MPTINNLVGMGGILVGNVVEPKSSYLDLEASAQIFCAWSTIILSQELLYGKHIMPLPKPMINSLIPLDFLQKSGKG